MVLMGRSVARRRRDAEAGDMIADAHFERHDVQAGHAVMAGPPITVGYVTPVPLAMSPPALQPKA
jgi:hypothetical protein